LANAVFRKFVDVRKNFDEKSYFINLIAYNIAPTLNGLKASTILNFSRTKSNMYDLWLNYKEEISQKFSLEYYELRKTTFNVIVLFYDKKRMIDIINKDENTKFLRDYGYIKMDNLDDYLGKLKDRYQSSCPHEIGVFLGIPLKDVIGFIENKGSDYLLNGYWKVYFDAESAKKTFKLYDNSRVRILENILKDI
jgi:hypothetical protein